MGKVGNTSGQLPNDRDIGRRSGSLPVLRYPLRAADRDGLAGRGGGAAVRFACAAFFLYSVYSMRLTNLSAEIAEHVRERIATGDLAAGERINESELAATLDVSRTPLREALSRLAAEGLVSVRARRGFFVQALPPVRVRELYQVRAILDPAALELAGLPGAGQLHRLEELNEAIESSAGDWERTIELDDAWHVELLSHCPNETVLQLIRRFMLRTRPLERAYMAEHPNVEVAVREHEKIMAALDADDLEGGVEALRRNMTSAIPVVMAWMAASETWSESP